MRVCLVILSLILCGAIAAPTASSISWSGNVSDGSAEFNYRASNIFSVPAVNQLYYYSVGANVNSATGTGNVDTVVAFLNGYTLPWAILSYFSSDVTGSTTSFDFTGGLGMIGSAYLSMVERKPDGTVVSSYPLSMISWSLGSTTVSTDGYLKSAALTGTMGTSTITITIIVSDIAGKIDYASAAVAPKSFEMVLEINGYTYSDDANHLELTMATMTKDVEFNGNAAITTTSDGAHLYFTLSSTCTINGGVVASVKISSYSAADYDSEVSVSTLKAYMLLVSGSFETKLVTISFPAGATQIIYDPAMGQGTPLYGTSSATGIVASFILTLAALFFSF